MEEKIKTLEGEILQKDLEEIKHELKFKVNFTLLEDERPSKNFLNLESCKGGYNEITILKVPNPNFNPALEESGLNNKFHELSKQTSIRDEVTERFQSYYNIQPTLKTGREDLMKFLKAEDDEAPFIEFQSKKIPNCMRQRMEGELSAKELHTALFEKMHGNSAPGLDGFTVNWLRTFWSELATITRNALNDCFHKGGLTGLLKTAVIRLLRKGLKDPTIAGNYRPI